MQAPKGFLFSAGCAGIRNTGTADVGLIVSERPATTAAIFTANRVVAAPITLSRENLRAAHGAVRALVVNAGNANCATPNGIRVARATAQAAAKLLRVRPAEVLVASTGVIGVPMDEQAIPRALPGVVRALAPDRFHDVATAMMTTDTRPKVAFRRAGDAAVLGMAKGAGMIHPRMATMLSFIVTDATVPPSRLSRITRSAANRTFNRISVDGDTSTNDTVFVLANRMAGLVDMAKLESAIEEVMGELAVAIASDGEGARKLVTVEVTGADSEVEAERVARSIANSPLVKTALAGGDPNWGRLLSAAGASGAPVVPERVKISMNGVTVCRRGQAAEFDEAALQRDLQAARDIVIRMELGDGPGRVRFWTCDLTEEYIRINASYRT